MKNYIHILLLVAIIFIICKCKSSSFTSVSSSEEEESIVYIIYAPWCGHCKKSMGEFKKASENDNIILVNSEDQSSKEIMNKFDVNGFPTIVRSDGTKYTGQRIADEIIDFANGN